MYVYIEEVFLINFFADLCVCTALRLVRKHKIKRIFISSFIGAVYSLSTLYLPFMSSFMFKGLILLLMVFCMTDNISIYNLCLNCLLVFSCSLVCAGFCILLSVEYKSAYPIGAFVPVTYPVFFFSILSGCAVFYVICALCKKNAGIKGEVLECLLFGEKCVKVRMLSDSGNLAKSPTGEPLNFVRAEKFEELACIKYMACENREDFFSHYLAGENADENHLSCIAVSTINSTLMLPAYKIEKAVCENVTVSPFWIAPMPKTNIFFDGIAAGGIFDKESV